MDGDVVAVVDERLVAKTVGTTPTVYAIYTDNSNTNSTVYNNMVPFT